MIQRLWKRYTWKRYATFLVLSCVAAIIMSLMFTGAPRVQASTGDWTTAGFSNARTGYNSGETSIAPATVGHLTAKWAHHAGGAISSQAIVANGGVYWGSWDGYEHETALNNAFVWATYLGKTVSPCGATATPFGPAVSGTILGVASTSTIATVNGVSMLFLGGGDGAFYALNALTGKILWRTVLGATSAGYFIWSSPAVYNGSVYIGVASIGDCPLVQGRLVRMNAASGTIQNTFATVPSGCSGASVWGAPAIDEAAGTVYFATGNPGSCGQHEQYAEALIEVSAANLAFIHSWQVPNTQAVGDGDFGSTPTLFQATINGVTHNLVGAPNKNGYYYAWDRSNISAGIVWADRIANGGSCPECDQGSISESAWDGAQLYLAGGGTTVNGVACKGSVRAVNPATGAYIWQHCLQSGPVLGSLTSVPGLIIATQGTDFNAMVTTSGQTLFVYHDVNSRPFYSGVTVSNGVLYVGNSDGNLYSFAP